LQAAISLRGSWTAPNLPMQQQLPGALRPISPLTPYGGIGLRCPVRAVGPQCAAMPETIKAWGYNEKINTGWWGPPDDREGRFQVSVLDAVLKAFLPATRAIDTINTWIGKKLAWLILAAVVVSAVNATIRKLFDTSSNSWLELQWVLFGIVFLLCAPWTLLSNEHIRIDIVNNLMPKMVRNWIDAIGHAFFLLPWCFIMVLTAVPFFWRSAMINEQSGNAGGLPQWPSKSLVMIGFAFLLLQGLSELIKRLSVMRNLIPDPHEANVNALEAEVERTVEAIEQR
jgi:TRAP-type mannitol/chloroaromatic compound transport system permease small subunit